MKYLSDYMQEKQTALFNETGSFFAFSQKQFDESKNEGVKYVDLGAGLICPKENVDKLVNGLEQIAKDAIKQDMEENGKVAIIHRELANHECQISMDITDVINTLSDYPITKKEIAEQWTVYFKQCLKNDCF